MFWVDMFWVDMLLQNMVCLHEAVVHRFHMVGMVVHTVVAEGMLVYMFVVFEMMECCCEGKMIFVEIAVVVGFADI